jgi:hypothetical protein
MKLKNTLTSLVVLFALLGFGCQHTQESDNVAKPGSAAVKRNEVDQPKGRSGIDDGTQQREAEPVVVEPSDDTTKPNPPVNQAAATGKKASSNIDVSNREKVSHTVIVFYFHPTFRCQACLDMEALSLEAIERGFSQAIENDNLIWLVLDFEEAENKGFVEDFEIEVSTLVLLDMHDGKRTQWKKLEKVWELLDDRDAFANYIQREVSDYLKK